MAKHRKKEWRIESGTHLVPGVGVVSGWWAFNMSDTAYDCFFVHYRHAVDFVVNAIADEAREGAA